MHDRAPATLDVCLWLIDAIAQTRSIAEIYDAALEALDRGLGVTRSSILFFDDDGVMRVKAWRGLSARYRRAVAGRRPWSPDSADPQLVIVPDVRQDASLASYARVFRTEKIAALASVRLVSQGRSIGQLLLYFGEPRDLAPAEQAFARLVASQVALATERRRAHDAALESQERLRFALDAAKMGTWEWDVATGCVRFSESVERIHGLRPGTFDGRVQSYEREIHPEDRAGVIASAHRAMTDGTFQDVEYRVIAPDGGLEWVESKGRLEVDAGGRPVRLLGVCMNITERKQAELERLAAAREASRMKDEFLAVLSHELRTPLNAIVGWLRLLQSGALDADRAAEALAIIDRNSGLQVQLIDQMLDVSRIIAGKLQVDRTPMLVSQLIEHSVKAVQPMAIAKGVRLITRVPDLLPLIEGDPERLQQILGNLLSNAVKFTPAGGDVRLTCVGSAETLRIEVCDTGIGFPPEFAPVMFERFRQADASMTRRHGGLGLGLAIARHLAELHGGTIEASSPGRDLGATFTLTLPVPRLVLAPRGPASREDLIGAGALLELDGAKVLVVDDEPDARELLKTLFAGQGSIVGEAASTAEALERLRADPFDLLVADLAMPSADGYALIQTLRRDGAELGAIAVTAFARPQDRARALQAGFDAFHAKPFDPAALLEDASGLRRRAYVSRR